MLQGVRGFSRRAFGRFVRFRGIVSGRIVHCSLRIRVGMCVSHQIHMLVVDCVSFVAEYMLLVAGGRVREVG